MSHGDPLKWHMPGWRIEQRYSPGVLIGNWSEERYNFLKGDTKANSTHRIDFMNYGNHRPDVIIRRRSQLRSEGLPAENLMHHHGKAYSKNMISWYDEDYNKREREPGDELPDLRTWDGNELAWRPERTDHPMQGAPTNFGLYQKQMGEWASQVVNETHHDFNTTYSASYTRPVRSALVDTRYATTKEHSTTLLKSNLTNKDLSLRGSAHFHLPEIIPNVNCPPGRPVLPPSVAVDAGMVAT